MTCPAQPAERGGELSVGGGGVGRSRSLIILVVLCHGLLGRPARSTIPEAAGELPEQIWGVRFGVMQPV
jgi:hypothetical protein